MLSVPVIEFGASGKERSPSMINEREMSSGRMGEREWGRESGRPPTPLPPPSLSTHLLPLLPSSSFSPIPLTLSLLGSWVPLHFRVAGSPIT